MAKAGLGQPMLEVGIGADMTLFEKTMGELRAEIGMLSQSINAAGKGVTSGIREPFDKAGKSVDDFTGFIRDQRKENRMMNFVFRESMGAVSALSFGFIALTSSLGDSNKQTQQINRTLAGMMGSFQGVSFGLQALKIGSAATASSIGLIVAVGVGLITLLDNSKEKAEANAKAFKRWADALSDLSAEELARELQHSERELGRMQGRVETMTGAGRAGIAGQILTALFGPNVEEAQKRVEAVYGVLGEKQKESDKLSKGMIPTMEAEIKALEKQKSDAASIVEISRLNLQIKEKTVALERARAGVTVPFEAVPMETVAATALLNAELDITAKKFKEIELAGGLAFGEALSSKINLTNDIITDLSLGITAVTDNLIYEASQADRSFGEMMQNFANDARQMIAAEIAMGVAAAIRTALVGVPFPFNIIAASVAAAGASALFQALIPKFAQGGLVYGPTLAMVGDNPGARSNPEVIAPLSELRGIGGQRVEVFGKVRIDGRDLVVVFENATDERGRVRGLD